MRKTTLSALLVAAGLGLAGVAQAQTFDSPLQAGEASTMTGGAPNALTTNSPYEDNGLMSTTILGNGPVVVDTTTLGAGPTVVTETVTTYSSPMGYSYVLPAPVVTYGIVHGGASETSNVPLRAGEASTMTGGVPNAVTNNYGW